MLFKFTAVRPFQSGHMSRIFNDRHLHAKTNPEIRHLVFPGILHRSNLSFYTAFAETAGDQNRIDITQTICAVAFDLFRINVLDIDPRAGMYAGMNQRLGQGFVGFSQIHVFTHHRNSGLTGGIG